MFFSTRTAKKPVANYILELRKKGSTFRQAVARILAENNVKTTPIPVVSIARNLSFSVYASTFKDETISGVMPDDTVQDYLSTLPFTTTRAEIVFGMTRKFFVSSETAECRLFEMDY